MTVRRNGRVGAHRRQCRDSPWREEHTDENPHVLYGTEALLILERGEVIATDTHLNEEGPVWYLLVRNPLTTNLWECTGKFPLLLREEAAARGWIGGFYRKHRAFTEPEYPEYWAELF